MSAELDGTVLLIELDCLVLIWNPGYMAVPPSLTRSEQKRGSILGAGRQLFLSNGYQGTSMDQVAAVAAVSKQTVYKHFGEKQELLFAIVTDALDSVVASIGHLIDELPNSI